LRKAQRAAVWPPLLYTVSGVASPKILGERKCLILGE